MARMLRGIGHKARATNPFSLTIPFAASVTITAAGNATATEEAFGAGNGATKGDYAKNLNRSITSGDTLVINTQAGYCYMTKDGPTILSALTFDGNGAGNIGDSTIANGGNLNAGQLKLSGTSSAAGLAFTCKNLIKSIALGSGGNSLITTLGNHGATVANVLQISGTGNPSYDKNAIGITAAGADTIQTDLTYDVPLGASNTTSTIVAVGQLDYQ